MRWGLLASSFLAVIAAAPLRAHAQSVSPARDDARAADARSSDQRADPWERFNRGAYAFGRFLDRAAFRPVALCYKHWVPRPLRAGVVHVLSNLDEPEIGVNDLLQGRPGAAGGAAARFTLNSILGIAGVFDVALHVGLVHHDNDAGLTLAHFGLAQGPYLFVPLVGPSSVRDLAGAGVDFLIDPLGWLRFRHADVAFDTQLGVGAIAARADADADLRDLDATAADPYATLRSFYLQSRGASEAGGGANLDMLAPMPDAPPAVETPPSAPALSQIPNDGGTTISQ